MQEKLNNKSIIDRCGQVSFKRGDSFYRAGKVKWHSSDPGFWRATVEGAEDFEVAVRIDEKGDIFTSCSCPKLASVKHDCQHIAAVLIALSKERREEMKEDRLAADLLNLFQRDQSRSSREQLHFEDRQRLHVEFELKGAGEQFSIALKIGPSRVEQICSFLMAVKEGDAYPLSAEFSYDPALHYFQEAEDRVIEKLIGIAEDGEMLKTDYGQERQLPIPPSVWDRLFPLLLAAPAVTVTWGADETAMPLDLSEELPLLRFQYSLEDAGYVLEAAGLDGARIMERYGVVVISGKVWQLEKSDCRRLAELKRLLFVSGTGRIPISIEKGPIFLQSVIPQLRRLGEVKVSKSVTDQFVKEPLIAKLYLDRVKDRLLASLEFHYGRLVINPVEDKMTRGAALAVRDRDKEEEILALMEKGSFTKTDSGYFLHHEELEYEFLHYLVPQLEKMVRVYATSAVRSRVVKTAVPPKISIKAKRERTNWLEFKFEMDDIPEKQIRDVLHALEEKRKYYRLRNGSLLSLETREFREIQQFLQALPNENADLGNGVLLPLASGLRLLDKAGSGSTIEFAGAMQQLMSERMERKKVREEVPPSLKAVMRDYQAAGYRWVKALAALGFGGILADDMGLGKTLQSIAYIVSELPAARGKSLPMLVVCPSSLTYNWLAEFGKFAPEVKAAVLDGSREARIGKRDALMEGDVVITSYPLLRADIEWYEKQSFHTVFFDEAHAFKNPVTRTWRAVRKINAEHRFALTGTPIENAPEELWSIFHIVFPELFSNLKAYSNLTRKEVTERIRPFLLRRMKKDILPELPEKIESIETADMLPEQKKLYTAYLAKLRHDAFKHLDKDTWRKNKIRILAGITRLRQICCHPALFVDGYKGGSAKFEQLKQLLKEARLSGRRILVFSQFTKMLELIGREMAEQGIPFFYLDGGTPAEERIAICDRFNSGERDVFLISLKAGGTGLNLTGADTVVLYDLWWNPAVEEQAADRAYRIGQTNTVQVIKLIARGTIEEKINELQSQKKSMTEQLLNPGEITDDQLKILLGI